MTDTSPTLAWKDVDEETWSNDWDMVTAQMGDTWRWGHYELHVWRHIPTGTLVGFDVQVTSGDHGGWECFNEFGFPVVKKTTVLYERAE